MSNQMVPRPTPQEVAFMSKTRSILEGNSNSLGPVQSQRVYETTNRANQNRNRMPIQPTYVPSNGYADTQAMKNVIESLSGILDEGIIPPTTNNNRVAQNRVASDSYLHESYGNSSNSYDWEVTVSLNENGTRKYEVKDANRNVYNNISFSLFEAALAVSKILNNNKSNGLINNIIGLDEDFSIYRKELMKSKQHYNKSIKLNENEAAAHFSKQIKKSQSLINAINESVKDILIDL